MKLNLGRLESPIGQLVLVSDENEMLRALDFTDHAAHLHRMLHAHCGAYELVDGPAPAHIAAALQRYFDGSLTAVNDLATATAGTELQERVWSALRGIEGGKTLSYGELARSLGFEDPRMAIEVGAANAANPIAIVVPCHRVIAKNGELRGYAWGVHRKRWLLSHEGAMPAADTVTPMAATPRLPGF